ncbi:MAG: bifunctional glutamate N-acetyltransferase/amino-acid acetyltransferase ArgJ [Gemmatimonadota bacterium]
MTDPTTPGTAAAVATEETGSAADRARSASLDEYRVEGSVCAPIGFRAAGVHCGIRYEHPDLALLASTTPASAAACFTTNRVQAAPVLHSRRAVRDGRASAVVVNSGVANACTGERGLEDCRETAGLVAGALGVPVGDVLVASTGLIGPRLPMDAIRRGVPKLIDALGSDAGPAARAILTTDRFTKTAAVRVPLSRGEVTVGGMAKGAGMIHPDMATTLGFLTTDAAVESDLLADLLRSAVEVSFNRISVDGETSTNDAVFCLANGRADAAPVSEREDVAVLLAGMTSVATRLANQVVRDGEGAERIARLHVTGARDDGAARAVADRLARSLLLKTALHGGDPNWGRIMAAVGSAGVDVDPSRIDVRIGGHRVARSGRGVPHDEASLERAMGDEEIEIEVSLGSGPGDHWIWTSDLGEAYVRLNSEYST